MVSYKLARADVAAFRNQMKRMETVLGKSVEQSIKWAAINLMKSLAARTLVSKKLRKIVKNPLYKAKSRKRVDQAEARQIRNDKRRAPWGVMRYERFGNGAQYFQPIYRTGEYGTIRFQNKKTAEWFTMEKGVGRVKRDMETGTELWQIEGIAQSKKRVIGRSGMAKKAWRWAQAHMYNSGNSGIMGVPNIIGVTVNGKGNDRSLTIHNRSRYAVDALNGGSSSVSEAMGAAARSLEDKINKELKKRASK